MEFNISFKSGFRKKLVDKAVKFYYNNIVGDSFPSSLLPTTDTTQLGLIKTSQDVPDIFMVTDYIAGIIANIPIKTVNRLGRDSTNTDLQSLIDTPNYYQNWKELIKTFIAFYEISGNGYLYGVKPTGMGLISELYCLPSAYTGVILERDKSLPSWLNNVAGYKVTINGKEYTLPAEEVLHKRAFNLEFADGSYIYGMSKYIPGNKLSKELLAIYDAKTSIIANRGALGLLSNESEIPDKDTTEQVQKRLAENFGLGADQNKVIVTTQKLSWVSMALNLQELQILENAKYSFAKVCQLNGIDTVVFSTEGSTFANKEQAYRAMMRNIIKVRTDDFYNDLNIWLSDYFGGYRIEPDWSQVDELQDDIEKLTKIYSMQIENGLLTPKEAYKKIYGVDAENQNISDEYFRKSSLVPVGEMPNEQQTDQATQEEVVRRLIEETQNNTGNGKANQNITV